MSEPLHRAFDSRYRGSNPRLGTELIADEPGTLCRNCTDRGTTETRPRGAADTGRPPSPRPENDLTQPGRRGARPGVPQMTPTRRAAYVARFWSKVDKSGGPDACWPWLGSRMLKGYGAATLDGERGAHRVAYALAAGAIPDGLHVLHACDSPPCCNPAHLSVGTCIDNSRDMRERGRSLTGERHRDAKLTARAVLEIRAAARDGVPHRQLAITYSVTPTAIYYVVIGKTWAHVATPHAEAAE